MKRFIEGVDRGQSTLFPACLEDWVDEDNPVRVIEAFVEALDLGGLGFSRVDPKATGRPSYHPSVFLKLYVYGYLNRVQSSRRLERDPGHEHHRHRATDQSDGGRIAATSRQISPISGNHRPQSTNPDPGRAINRWTLQIRKTIRGAQKLNTLPSNENRQTFSHSLDP
jgi:hypothetical protein